MYQANQMTKETDNNHNSAWLPDYIKAFGNPGLAVLAFWLGSLFAQQIREKQKTFPFLELTGSEDSGKSTVTQFCWKLVGRENYEGFSFALSTPAGILRELTISNLPTVNIEADFSAPFDFEEYKHLYNGQIPCIGSKSDSRDELEDVKWRGSLMIQHIKKLNGLPALENRIVNVHMDRGHHTPGTLEIVRWCQRQTIKDLSEFLRISLLNEKEILETYFTSFTDLEITFTEHGIHNNRIIKNHAQIAACAHALPILFPDLGKDVLQDFTLYLIDRAILCQYRTHELEC